MLRAIFAALLLAAATQAGATPPPPIPGALNAPPPIPAELRPPGWRAPVAAAPGDSGAGRRRIALAAALVGAGYLATRGGLQVAAQPAGVAVAYRWGF